MRRLAIVGLVLGLLGCGGRQIQASDDEGGTSTSGSTTGTTGTESSTTEDTGTESTTDQPKFDIVDPTGMPPPEEACFDPLPGSAIVGETEFGPVNIDRVFVAGAGCGWPRFRLVMLDEGADLAYEVAFADANGGELDEGPGIGTEAIDGEDEAPFTDTVLGYAYAGGDMALVQLEVTVEQIIGLPWEPGFAMQGHVRSLPADEAPSFEGPFVAGVCPVFDQLAICE